MTPENAGQSASSGAVHLSISFDGVELVFAGHRLWLAHFLVSGLMRWWPDNRTKNAAGLGSAERPVEGDYAVGPALKVIG